MVKIIIIQLKTQKNKTINQYVKKTTFVKYEAIIKTIQLLTVENHVNIYE